MEKKAMRVVFGETLKELGAHYPNLAVLDADVSSSTQTKIFSAQYPGQFYNFGIAEANMVSAAAGMAACGLIPVVSTFAFLIAMRAADPVRSLIAYNNLNVKLAGGYAGLSDFADGASHQSIADIAVMRALPNMTILCPSDIETTQWAVKAMLEHTGPVYLRLSRDLAGSLHPENSCYSIGKANKILEGTDITIAVSGPLLEYALEAAEKLSKKGIRAEVLEFITIKPLDTKALMDSVSKTGAIVTVEEHNILGGFGGAVAEELGENFPVRMKRVGLKDCFGESGPYRKLLDYFQLSSAAIESAVLQLTGKC